MVNLKLGYKLSLVLVMLLVIAPCIYSFSTKFDETFIEGVEKTVGLGILDTLEFDYYNQTYSLRVLGIYTKSATVRVEHTAFDISLDQPKSIDLDDTAEYDFVITLTSTDGDGALFKVKLNEKPWANEIDDDQDTTDDVDNSTEDTTGYIRRRNSTRTITTTQNSTSTSIENEDEEKKTALIGDAPINITINLTLTPKSAIGLLLVVGIVFVGMHAYKGSGTKKRRRKNYETILDRFIRKVEKKVIEIWKKVRLKLAEFIAGEELKQNPKK